MPPGWSDSLNFGAYIVPGDFASFGSDLFIFTGQGIYYSTDDGVTTTKRDAGIYFNTSAGSFLKKDNFLFAYVPGTGLMRTSDLGKTWTQVGKTIGAYNPFVYNSVLYCASGGANSAYRSTDNGDNWTSISAGLPSGLGEVFVEIGGKFYIYSHYSGTCYSSSDQGMTWALYTGPARAAIAYGSINSAYACKAVTANGTTLVGRNYAFYAGDTVALVGAPSGSEDFTPGMTGLGNVGEITSIAVSGNNVFAAGRKVFHSNDNGTTWTNITPTNPVSTSYYVLGIADDVLFVGGEGIGNAGVLVRRPLSDFN